MVRSDQGKEVQDARGAGHIEALGEFKARFPAVRTAFCLEELEEIPTRDRCLRLGCKLRILGLVKLGAERQDQFHFLFDERADIHYKIRHEVVVLNVVV